MVLGRFGWFWLVPCFSNCDLLTAALLKAGQRGTGETDFPWFIKDRFFQSVILFFTFLLRVWYRNTGHFIGFFSQPRLWHLPSAKSVPSTPVRPYDISEVCKLSDTK